MTLFLAKQPGPSYWFRKNRDEEIRHLLMLESAERLARLAGINTKPTEGKRNNGNS